MEAGSELARWAEKNEVAKMGKEKRAQGKQHEILSYFLILKNGQNRKMARMTE